MRASNELMTVAQLKRSTDHRFNRLHRSMDARFRSVDVRFKRIDDRFERIDDRFKKVDERFDRLEREMRQAEERIKRHFEVVVESIHDDMRMFAEAIGVQSERLGDHETRLRRRERRRLT